MKSFAPFLVILLAAVAFGQEPVEGPAGEAPAKDRRPDCGTAEASDETANELVADFNRVVQVRFESFDDFGLRRVMTPYQHDVYRPVFTPESKTEIDVVCALVARRADVAILVGGRGLLGYTARPPEPELLGGGEARAGQIRVAGRGDGAMLSEAVRVTGTYADADLPDRAVLRDVAATAMRSGNAERTHGNWAIAGYAISATQDACVKCHNGENDAGVPHPTLFADAPRLAVGDPIGVALYVSRVDR
jgi:hypothetical protein